MLDIFLKIIDSIFPPPDSIKKLKHENSQNFLRHFSEHKYQNCLTLSDYNNPFIKSAITANKFHDYERAGILLATLVEHWLSTQPESLIIFVPIPLSSTRLKSRGYNQVTRVLEKIDNDNVSIQNLLIRNIDTKPQTSLHRAERLKNLDNAFTYKISIPQDYSNKKIVIVDDVLTTGATILSAEKVLRQNLPGGCEIICLALAH